MALVEESGDILALMVMIIGIAYPLVITILRSSIKSNEEWMVRVIREHRNLGPNPRKDTELEKRAKVLGYYNTMDELLAYQVIISTWSWSLIFAGSALILIPELLSGGEHILIKIAVLLIVIGVWLFFGGLLCYSVVSMNRQRKYLDATVIKAFDGRVWLIRRGWYFGTWRPIETYDTETKKKVLYPVSKEC